LGPRKLELSPASSVFAAQFTTDVLLSLVLPHLVWRAGLMAAALRKLAAATLFALLSHYHKKNQLNQETDALHPDTSSHLIPILHSNLEDTEATTRELSCVCLSMLLEMSNDRAIDTLYPRLLGLLDDSHSAVRVAAARALRTLLTLSHESIPASTLELSLLEDMTSRLLIHLDDPDPATQESVHHCLLLLVELQFQGTNGNKGVIEMMERQINWDPIAKVLPSCSDFQQNYRQMLLERLQKRSAELQR